MGGIAVRRKTTVGIGGRIDLQTWCLIIVEGAKQSVISIRLQAIMLQDLADAKLLFDVFELHVEKIII